jgi:TRAP-type C4-dicarboxylate transport system permease small subunit
VTTKALNHAARAGRLARLDAWVGAAEMHVASVAMLVLLATNGYAIASRYLFALHPAWIIEVTEALLVVVVFAGGSWLYRARRQIAITMLVDRLATDGMARRVLDGAAELVVLIFALVTLWQAAKYQPILASRKTPVLGLPANLSSIMVPVAYAAIALTSIVRLRQILRGRP